MKTLKKIILSFILLSGWYTMFILLTNYTIDWVYYSTVLIVVFLTVIILILFSVYRTKKTYWRFYYKGESSTGKGIVISNNEFFPIEEAEKTLKEEVPEHVWVILCMQN